MFRIAGYIFVLVFLQNAKFARAELYNKHLTIYADAGRQECYYQPIVAAENIRIEYQVIHGGHGEAHVNFYLMDPSRKLLITDQKQGKGKHSLVAENTGSYELCFDNTISTFNQKIISYSLEVTAADHDEQDLRKYGSEMLTDYQFENAYTHIHSYLANIRVNLLRSRQTQDFIRALEARDRNVAESNYAMVNNWSWVQFWAMILVALLQVFMLRSIFSTQGTFYEFWKRF
ncbi:hypothetical protein KR009_009522 [Drosophila setifemur]|nr:hypothetical protein KR009_009522 [Drosophila setifemur]